ncbi:hypothetical protein EON65_51300 [archaeon]|nr:MAG: hypothetical protein EON65_51300 [archaeon]
MRIPIANKAPTLTKDWQAANKEYMKFQNNNPISGKLQIKKKKFHIQLSFINYERLFLYRHQPHLLSAFSPSSAANYMSTVPTS